MTLEEFHAAMLALIDERMQAEDGERSRELRALADACVAYEAVMFPIEGTDPSHDSPLQEPV